MIEKHIVLEDIDPVAFFGVGNGHLQMLKSLYPKLRIVARGNVIRLLGDEEEMARFEESVSLLRKHLLKYNQLGEEDILDIVKGRLTKADGVKGVLVYSMSGRPIKPRSANQQELIDAYERNDMVFAVGPAGTGKTYLSIALAVKALKEKTAKKIILSRPAVEAGEKLGFLPGDMKDKIDPYLQPLYDALEDMLPQARLQDMMDKHQIQIAPLAFMRGRTLSDAVVILDEAQNTTPEQIRMEHKDDHHGRYDTDRPAPRTEERTARGPLHPGRRRGHWRRRADQEGHRPPQARHAHRQRLRGLRQGRRERKERKST